MTATRSAAVSCTLTATETQGPYPLLAILSNSAMPRSDIREGKTRVPLTVNLSIQDLSAGCAPVSGAAVYIWHCDKDGLYSGYNVSNYRSNTNLCPPTAPHTAREQQLRIFVFAPRSARVSTRSR